MVIGRTAAGAAREAVLVGMASRLLMNAPQGAQGQGDRRADDGIREAHDARRRHVPGALLDRHGKRLGGRDADVAVQHGECWAMPRVHEQFDMDGRGRAT